MNKIGELIKKEIESIAFNNIDYDTSIIKSGILDSISLIDLLISIEEKLEINIPALDINEENFDSVDKILEYLKDKI